MLGCRGRGYYNLAPRIGAKGDIMYEDKTLVCAECNNEFVFSASEQEFYAEKGFENEPKRCPTCRQERKKQRRAQRQMHEIVCDGCGKTATVPFLPRGDRPVYCDECFKAQRGE
jgi:CxxC-x17-CxxC domain-containing protein